MKRLLCFAITAFLMLLVFTPLAPAQQDANREALIELSESLAERLDSRRTRLYYDLLASTEPAVQALNQNPDFQLMYISICSQFRVSGQHSRGPLVPLGKSRKVIGTLVS